MWPFKKKEDELAKFERELGLGSRDTGMETAREPKEESYDRLKEDMPEEPKYEYSSPKQQSLQQFSQQSDIQLISAKLDTIKAMLDMINQRIASLEKNVEEKDKKQKMW